MQAIELNLNMIFAQNPNLVNSRNRLHNHPFNQKLFSYTFQYLINVCERYY